ncbi:unnamed protein product [marine sediment metagenome]|uniref:Uncharacterized protein n=1 Tax=marine sediment metagenome TaxID=412755 RepID=X1KG28_9ZZZZ
MGKRRGQETRCEAKAALVVRHGGEEDRITVNLNKGSGAPNGLQLDSYRFDPKTESRVIVSTRGGEGMVEVQRIALIGVAE